MASLTTRRYSVLDALRGVAVLSVLVLAAVLLALLRAPGYGTSRLVLFSFVLLVGTVGAVGALRDRPGLMAVGAVGLFLLGFWQFTIGLVMLPAAAVLGLAATLTWAASQPKSGAGA